MALYQQGKAKEIPLADFAPDLDPATPGILLDTSNAMPTLKGYQCLNSPQPVIPPALPETPLGSTITHFGGRTQYFAGGTNHLWKLDVPSSTWVQADGLSGGSFGALAWNFARFNDDLIAVGGGSVAPQLRETETATFHTLGGNPPVGAAVVVSVNSQVMMFLGNTWYVSALGSDNSWAASTQTQAGNAPITDLPGAVIAAAPLYRGVVAFKNIGIWLGSYVGGASIWSFQLISDVNGIWGQGCAVVLPDGVAFLGLDDFYLTTGFTPQRIPNNIKEWFFDTVDPTQLSSTQSRFDPYHAIIYWYAVSKQATTAGQPDFWVAYNIRAQKWARGSTAVTSVPWPNTQPGTIAGSYFDQNNILQSLTGPPGAMRLRTGWFGMPGKLSQLMKVRPKYNVAPGTDTLHAYHVNIIGQRQVVGPAGVKGTDGWFYLRQYDRYHSVEVEEAGSAIQPLANLDSGAEVVSLSFEAREGGDR